MKIAIISDLHLGYGQGTEREDDAYDAMEEMLDKVKDCDAILIAGDLFDTRVPKTETFVRAMQLLTKPMQSTKPDSGAKISEGINNKKVSDIPLIRPDGIPVVAIHGTHERRVKGLLNPVEALERAGFITYLHCNGIVLEKGGERVCVQGMSGVPDQYAASVLEQWNPNPVSGCFNIFMIHQSIAPFMYASHLLPVEKFPKGFDFYICGHMHDPFKTIYDNGALIIPGAPVTTQITKDSVNPGGLWIVDTQTGSAEQSSLDSYRKVYYRELDIGTTGRAGIENEIKHILRPDNHHNKKPIIRIKLTGKDAELPLDEIKSRFQDHALVSFRKITDEDKIEAKTIEEHKLSVQELGKKLLEENMKQANLDPKIFDHVFELLLENKVDEVVSLLNGE
jgi:DNA repair exonuclease SbcCD nuclease subunit